jgi:hypothetical protein
MPFQAGSFSFSSPARPPSSADTNQGGDDKEKTFVWAFEILSSSWGV